jgi:hypothetical protein
LKKCWNKFWSKLFETKKLLKKSWNKFRSKLFETKKLLKKSWNKFWSKLFEQKSFTQQKKTFPKKIQKLCGKVIAKKM